SELTVVTGTFRRLPRDRFVCHRSRATLLSWLCDSRIWGKYDPIAHTSRPVARHRRARHTRHRPTYSRCVVDPLSVGPQIAPWPFERTRKAHLAVAPHRDRT